MSNSDGEWWEEERGGDEEDGVQSDGGANTVPDPLFECGGDLMTTG